MSITPEEVLRYALWALPALLVLLAVLVIRRRRKEPRPRPATPLPLDRPEMLQAAFDRASVGVGFVTGDGQWLEANRRLLSILGYSFAEFGNLPLRFLTHPDDRKREAPLLAEIRAGKRAAYAMTKRLMRKSGDYRSARVHMLRCAESPQPLFQCIVEDSGHQSTPVEAIFAAMAEVPDSAAILCDASGLITGWNKGAERLFGHAAEEILSTPWMKLHVGETKESLTRLIGTAAQNGFARALNKRVLHDGSHVVVRSVIIPDLLRGDASGFLEICHEETAAARKAPAERQSDSALAKTLEENAAMRDAIARAESAEAELRQSVTSLKTTNAELSRKVRLLASAIRKMLPARKPDEPQIAAVPAAPAAAVERTPVELTWRSVTGEDLGNTLAAVAEEARSGVLHLRSDHGEKRFVFENGQLIACSSDRDERLLGQLLVDAGVIDEAQRGAALETHRATGVPFGSSIVNLGLATEDDVAEIIRAKAKNEIADAAAWQQAEWAFTESTTASAAMVPIAIDVLAVLAELTPAGGA
ncbi:MAG TPA: PAS domain S-box protein [Thermoanaerobaculia bacterium]|nr:PAS domain S-box protein [Thermoanaerobaculia bacterium]